MNAFSRRLFPAAAAFLLMTASDPAAPGVAPVLAQPRPDAPPLKILFLGDRGHHQPHLRFRQIQPVLARRGIDVVYTEQTGDLNPSTLAAYDALLIYANIERISPEQERALLEFVEGGKGLIPVHCASYCFLNSPRYVALVGAQFLRHETGVFRPRKAADAALTRGFESFESWDETYVHARHNTNGRTVLEVRDDPSGEEPWTWIREQGKGRVFYTAWGHDDRTWGHPGFANLLERGIRWACRQDPGQVPDFSDAPRITPPREDVARFEYVPANVPYYPAGAAWGTLGEAIRRMQKPLPPEESLKHYRVPEGFALELFASEPQIGKPLAMAWDERGRLWLCESVDYPNDLQPRGRGHDRVRICEDTDGDGRADKFTVFADQLSIPTSLTFARGGAIVHQAPDTLFLKDTDGDDRADVRELLFTGWGTADTHAGPSNLQYGFDNWIYGIVGYSGFTGTVGGVRHSFRNGFYRFKPDGSEIEFLRSTSNNSWGVGFDESGVLFGSTANGNPSVYLPIPNRFYEAVRGWSSTVLGSIADNDRFYPVTDKVRQVDVHGGFTAGAGHALYTARAWPEIYWNRAAFVCEPTGHLVATFLIQQNGADFRSRNRWNAIASDDEWAAPIAAEVGPDGQLWIIDWYNFIIQHNPTPDGFNTGKGNAYETPLRDKTHGRIYRLVWKGASSPSGRPHAGPPFDPQQPRSLAAALAHDNLLWRRHAQRLLVERGETDVALDLAAQVRNPHVDAVGLTPGAVHALWTLHGLGIVGRDDVLPDVIAALSHPSAAVRRTAAQVMPRTPAGRAALLESQTLNDVDGLVRLAALLALAEMPPNPTASAEDPRGPGRTLLRFLSDGENLADRWLIDAATAAAARHDREFLMAWTAADSPAAAAPAVAVLGERVAEHVARGHDAETVRSLLPRLAAAPPAVGNAVVAGLGRGWPENRPPELSAETEQALVKLATRLTGTGRTALLRLTQKWQTKVLDEHLGAIAETLLAEVRNASLDDASRLAAGRQLLEIQPRSLEAARALLEQITPRSPPEFARGLFDALRACEVDEFGAVLAGRLAGLSPQSRPRALQTLLSRPAWTGALLDAMTDGTVAAADLTADQTQQLLAHPTRTIAERARELLARAGGLPDPDRQKVVESLLPLLERTGRVAAGKELFTKHCAKCHRHSGEGEAIGPDLTGMAVHPKHELLIHLIDPSRSVEGNFRVYTVVLADGRVQSGLLASESRTSIELVDAEAKRHLLQRDEIDELAASTKSLMPEGFEKQISETELVDLLEFLTHKGRFVPLDLRKAATVVTTKGMFYSEEADVERLIFSDWKPKTFEGVPFVLVDPLGDRVPNAVMLRGRLGTIPPKMPETVKVPCKTAAKTLHLLSGVSGWGFPYDRAETVTMTVRLHYADGEVEDHPLRNGVEFADYIRKVEVPGSKFAFALRGQQIRYLALTPKRSVAIDEIEFVKGPHLSVPVVMAVTVETPEN